MPVLEEPPSDDDSSQEDRDLRFREALAQYLQRRVDGWFDAMDRVREAIEDLEEIPESMLVEWQYVVDATALLHDQPAFHLLLPELERRVHRFFTSDVYAIATALSGESYEATVAREALSEFGNAPLLLDNLALNANGEPVAGRVRASQLVHALLKGGDFGAAIMQNQIARFNLSSTNALKERLVVARLDNLRRHILRSLPQPPYEFPDEGELFADELTKLRELWIGGEDYADWMRLARLGDSEGAHSLLRQLDARRSSLARWRESANHDMSGSLRAVFELLDSGRHTEYSQGLTADAVARNWRTTMQWISLSDSNREAARILIASAREQANFAESAIPYLDVIESMFPPLDDFDEDFVLQDRLKFAEVRDFVHALDLPQIEVPEMSLPTVADIASSLLSRVEESQEPALIRLHHLQRVLVEVGRNDSEFLVQLVAATYVDPFDDHKSVAAKVLTSLGDELDNSIRSPLIQRLLLTSDFNVRGFADILPDEAGARFFEQWQTFIMRSGLSWDTAYLDEVFQRACVGIVQAMKADPEDRARKSMVDFILRSQGMAVDYSDDNPLQAPYIDDAALRAVAYSELGVHLIPEMVRSCNGRLIPRVFAEAYASERKEPFANHRESVKEIVRDVVRRATRSESYARDVKIIIGAVDQLRASTDGAIRNAAFATMAVKGYEAAEHDLTDLPQEILNRARLVPHLVSLTGDGRRSILEDATAAYAASRKVALAFVAAKTAMNVLMDRRVSPDDIAAAMAAAQVSSDEFLPPSERVAQMLGTTTEQLDRMVHDKWNELRSSSGNRLRTDVPRQPSDRGANDSVYRPGVFKKGVGRNGRDGSGSGPTIPSR